MEVILKDSTETLLVYPPQQYLAQPSAADVRIGTPSTTMPDEGSEETATIDAVSTTLSAAASRGDTTLTLTSTSGITDGRKYLVEDSGRNIVVKVVSTSGSTAYLSEPLSSAIASGSSFKGIAVTHQLTTTETSELGRAFAIFRLTLDGVVQRIEKDFRIETGRLQNTLTSVELLRRKEIRKLRQSTDMDLDEVIEAAFQRMVVLEIEARGMIAARINNAEKLEPATEEAVIYMLMRAAGRPDDDVFNQERRFNRVFEKVMSGREFWYDEEGQDEDLDDVRQHPRDSEISWVSR